MDCKTWKKGSSVLVGLVILLFGVAGSVNALNVAGLEDVLEPNSEYLFGFSGLNTNTLTYSLSGGGGGVVDTNTGLFGSARNQGWWSSTHVNNTDNDNYLVGDLSSNGSTLLRNFFTFDISNVTGTVTSATFNVRRYEGLSDLGYLYQQYSLWDVNTGAATLNNNVGTNATIFNDLGSGRNYGSYAVSVAGNGAEILNFTLNGAGIADLNTAIGNSDQHWSIGGRLDEIPEPTTLGLLGLGLLGFAARRRRRK